MLTPKQLQTYEFVKAYIADHGYAPTEAEIAAGIGIRSRGVAHRYVKALYDAKLLEIEPNRRRNIKLTQDSRYALPVIGRIAAGSPIQAIELQQQFDFQAFLGPDRFILQVEGDSMLGDNIVDGDYIVCEKASVASRHDIVVALIDGQEATLKRVTPNTDGTVTLLPSNPKISPMTYRADQVMIQGRYLGLLRLS